MPKTRKPRKSSPRFEFNGGLVGQSRPAANTAAVEPCTVDGCGTTADQPRPAPAMIRVEVAGTGEPARWYCPGRCAAIGRALADVRGIDRPGGEAA
ncbi:hypothetical protein AB0P07_12035 [Streptomyces sp. NPDC085944]|uniref:hypothetical protein n=1 Tax=Streptomyces sp. NPDC085944 TaxID=3154962 RepID=UPI0034436E54